MAKREANISHLPILCQAMDLVLYILFHLSLKAALSPFCSGENLSLEIQLTCLPSQSQEVFPSLSETLVLLLSHCCEGQRVAAGLKPRVTLLGFPMCLVQCTHSSE